MTTANLSVSKLVATATATAWSQAYNAGVLTAVVSLSKKESSEEQDTSLHVAGKNLINTLETEFFSLETKNLTNIKQMIEKLVGDIPKDCHVSFVVGVVLQNILYVFIFGSGKVILKREGKLGTLLQHGTADPDLIAASGFLQNGDIAILETHAFSETISLQQLEEALSHNSPEETIEALSPMVHEKQNGAIAGLVFSYKDDAPDTKEEFSLEDTKEEPKEAEKEISLEDEPKETTMQQRYSLETPRKNRRFSHKQKLLISIAIILVFVLGVSIYFSIQQQQKAKTKALFDSLFTPAEQKYQEGKSLEQLNQNLARDDYKQAAGMLNQMQGKFANNSPEEKQVTDLLTQINNSIQSASQVNSVTAKQVDSSENALLGFAAKNDAQYFTEDASNFYAATDTDISSTGKTSTKTKVVVKNDSDWSAIGGFGTYLGNLYLLDKKTNAVLKYVPAGSGFSKNTYFAKGVTPDLSKAVSLSIDGSIWILGSDGTILKFTRGTQDDFTTNGLDKPFSSPTQIVTSVDDDNLYILDNGNNRIVVLKKNGQYVAQYQATVIKNATQLAVSEKDKKVFVLSGKTVFEIDLK
ncbi:MAG: hypothetical protein ACREGI_02855 [Candidatus Levyibacteriota bacterium]